MGDHDAAIANKHKIKELIHSILIEIPRNEYILDKYSYHPIISHLPRQLTHLYAEIRSIPRTELKSFMNQRIFPIRKKNLSSEWSIELAFEILSIRSASGLNDHHTLVIDDTRDLLMEYRKKIVDFLVDIWNLLFNESCIEDNHDILCSYLEWIKDRLRPFDGKKAPKYGKINRVKTALFLTLFNQIIETNFRENKANLEYLCTFASKNRQFLKESPVSRSIVSDCFLEILRYTKRHLQEDNRFALIVPSSHLIISFSAFYKNLMSCDGFHDGLFEIEPIVDDDYISECLATCIKNYIAIIGTDIEFLSRNMIALNIKTEANGQISIEVSSRIFPDISAGPRELIREYFSRRSKNHDHSDPLPSSRLSSFESAEIGFSRLKKNDFVFNDKIASDSMIIILKRMEILLRNVAETSSKDSCNIFVEYYNFKLNRSNLVHATENLPPDTINRYFLMIFYLSGLYMAFIKMMVLRISNFAEWKESVNKNILFEILLMTLPQVCADCNTCDFFYVIAADIIDILWTEENMQSNMELIENLLGLLEAATCSMREPSFESLEDFSKFINNSPLREYVSHICHVCLNRIWAVYENEKLDLKPLTLVTTFYAKILKILFSHDKVDDKAIKKQISDKLESFVENAPYSNIKNIGTKIEVCAALLNEIMVEFSDSMKIGCLRLLHLPEHESILSSPVLSRVITKIFDPDFVLSLNSRANDSVIFLETVSNAYFPLCSGLKLLSSFDGKISEQIFLNFTKRAISDEEVLLLLELISKNQASVGSPLIISFILSYFLFALNDDIRNSALSLLALLDPKDLSNAITRYQIPKCKPVTNDEFDESDFLLVMKCLFSGPSKAEPLDALKSLIPMIIPQKNTSNCGNFFSTQTKFLRNSIVIDKLISFLIDTRLKATFNRPRETLDFLLDSYGNVKFDSDYISNQDLERLSIILKFHYNFEKKIDHVAHGRVLCIKTKDEITKASRLFFAKNRKVCDHWFKSWKIRRSILEIAKLLAQFSDNMNESLYYYSQLELERVLSVSKDSFDENHLDQLNYILPISISLYCEKQDAEAIFGLINCLEHLNDIPKYSSFFGIVNELLETCELYAQGKTLKCIEFSLKRNENLRQIEPFLNISWVFQLHEVIKCRCMKQLETEFEDGEFSEYCFEINAECLSFWKIPSINKANHAKKSTLTKGLSLVGLELVYSDYLLQERQVENFVSNMRNLTLLFEVFEKHIPDKISNVDNIKGKASPAYLVKKIEAANREIMFGSVSLAEKHLEFLEMQNSLTNTQRKKVLNLRSLVHEKLNSKSGLNFLIKSHAFMDFDSEMIRLLNYFSSNHSSSNIDYEAVYHLAKSGSDKRVMIFAAYLHNEYLKRLSIFKNQVSRALELSKDPNTCLYLESLLWLLGEYEDVKADSHEKIVSFISEIDINEVDIADHLMLRIDPILEKDSVNSFMSDFRDLISLIDRSCQSYADFIQNMGPNFEKWLGLSAAIGLISTCFKFSKILRKETILKVIDALTFLSKVDDTVKQCWLTHFDNMDSYAYIHIFEPIFCLLSAENETNDLLSISKSIELNLKDSYQSRDLKKFIQVLEDLSIFPEEEMYNLLIRIKPELFKVIEISSKSLNKDFSTPNVSKQYLPSILPIVMDIEKLLQRLKSTSRILNPSISIFAEKLITFKEELKLPDWRKFSSDPFYLVLKLKDIILEIGTFLKKRGILKIDEGHGLKSIDFDSIKIKIPGCNDGVYISQISETLEVIDTKTRPKKIKIVGSDGKTYDFLLKGWEDLHLDQRMMIFIETVNIILLNEKLAFNVRTYPVVPIGRNAGLIKWVEKTHPFYQIYKKWQDNEKNQSSKSNSLWFKGPNEQWNKLMKEYLRRKSPHIALSREQLGNGALVAVFTKLSQKCPKNLLIREVFHSSNSLNSFMHKKEKFTRSIAAVNMLGYFIGLGDRHLDNILLDVNQGDLINIDYNVCFEKGKYLRVAETVPFRLTQNLKALMGKIALSGSFLLYCRQICSKISRNSKFLINMLEFLLSDPKLIFWNERWDKNNMDSHGSPSSLVGMWKDLIPELNDEIPNLTKNLDKNDFCSLQNCANRMKKMTTPLHEAFKNLLVSGKISGPAKAELESSFTNVTAINNLIDEILPMISSLIDDVDNQALENIFECAKELKILLQEAQDDDAFEEIKDDQSSTSSGSSLSMDASQRSSNFGNDKNVDELKVIGKAHAQMLRRIMHLTRCKMDEFDCSADEQLNHVKRLTNQATSTKNLAKMFEGWAPWV